MKDSNSLDNKARKYENNLHTSKIYRTFVPTKRLRNEAHKMTKLGSLRRQSATTNRDLTSPSIEIARVSIGGGTRVGNLGSILEVAKIPIIFYRFKV